MRLVAQTAARNFPGPPSVKDQAFYGLTSKGLVTWDAAGAGSYPLQTDPVDGTVLLDCAAPKYGYGDLQLDIANGQSLLFANRAFDFQQVDNGNVAISTPSGIMDDIFGRNGSGAIATPVMSGSSVTGANIDNSASDDKYIQGLAHALWWDDSGSARPIMTLCTVVGGAISAIALPGGTWVNPPTIKIIPSPQHFLVILYARLPSEADWNDDAANSEGMIGLATNEDDDAGTYSKRLFRFGMRASNTDLRFYMNSGNGTQVAVDHVPTGSFGQLTQIMFARTAAGRFVQTRPMVAGAEPLLSSSTAAIERPATDTDFRGSKCHFGFWGSLAKPVVLQSRKKGMKFELLRGLIEAPSVTGRDIFEVADADWRRQMLRLALWQ